MDKFKETYKKDSSGINECQDIYDDVDLSGARQVQHNIQDVVDEWWSNNNLTEEQQIRKKELFPNEKPSADEFLITFVEHVRNDPKFQKMQEEIEKKKRKRQIIKDVLLVSLAILLLLFVTIHLCTLEKNNHKKDSQTETSTSMKDYW